MKVRGDFLGPPRSTDKTTLIIKVIRMHESQLSIQTLQVPSSCLYNTVVPLTHWPHSTYSIKIKHTTCDKYQTILK